MNKPGIHNLLEIIRIINTSQRGLAQPDSICVMYFYDDLTGHYAVNFICAASADALRLEGYCVLLEEDTFLVSSFHEHMDEWEKQEADENESIA